MLGWCWGNFGRIIIASLTPGLKVIKKIFMLNSVEHEILNAHKYINMKKFSFFQAKMSIECYFSCS